MRIPEALPDNVFYAIAVIYGLLIIASVVVAVMKRTRKGEAQSEAMTELSRRVTSWWFMITIFSIAIVTNRIVSTVFLAFMTFLAFKEYLSLIQTRRVDRLILLFAYWTIPVQFFFAHLNSYGLFLTFIPVWTFLFIPMAMTLAGKTEGFLRAVGTISWGLMISTAQTRILQYPHLLLFPGIFLSVAVFSFILMGDALRDALDPRLR